MLSACSWLSPYIANDRPVPPWFSGQVIEGLDLAVMKMKEGERALVTIAPQYAWGEQVRHACRACGQASSPGLHAQGETHNGAWQMYFKFLRAARGRTSAALPAARFGSLHAECTRQRYACAHRPPRPHAGCAGVAAAAGLRAGGGDC